MKLRLDLEGVEIRLWIRDYQFYQPHRHYYDDEWCQVALSLKSEWLDYSIDSELLLSCEIETLRNKLMQLTEGRISEEETLEFVEPDLTFIIYPSIAQADLRIAFWHDGLTADFLSLCLDDRDLKDLLMYLQLITGERTMLDEDVAQRILDGIFVPE